MKVVSRILGIDGRWTPARVTLTQAVAIVPPLVAAILVTSPAKISVLLLALITAFVWEITFNLIRGRSVGFHGLTTALIVAVMIPTSVPLWQVVLAVSFGVVLGELVFGGRGFGFVSAPVATLAFLVFSFPGTGLEGSGQAVALASLPGAVLLLLTGLISGRAVLAFLVAFALVVWLGTGGAPALTSLVGLTFGIVFLICDPVGAASTNPGRVVYGALAGGLVALFGADPVGLVFAALLASVFAPLIDQLVVLAHIWKRGRRHG